MQSALYVGLSAQVSLDKRLETIANNISNMNTSAYRADVVKFDVALSRAGASSVAFSTPGENVITRHAGNLTQTGNPLDAAVVGEGWLAFSGPNGTVYTRDGRMQINGNGDLQTIGGFPVQDASGSPILVDPNGGPLSIGRNGTITQDGNEIGILGLFDIAADAKLRRFGNSGVMIDRPAPPVTDFTKAGFQQGYVEGSNINPMMELTKMMGASRAFESANALLESTESSMQSAIRTLGEPAKA
jgi:flagellar basal-body rod protein FlgF